MKNGGEILKEFEKVYLDYYDIVYKYILSLCNNESFAEEITQEAFFKALKKIDSFRGECKLDVWLCQIAKNTFYTEIKKRNKEVELSLDIPLSENSIDQKIFYKAEAFEIHKILHKLNEPYKEVFWMRTFGDMSFKEISNIFNKTESWARVTYHRAKMKIMEELK